MNGLLIRRSTGFAIGLLLICATFFALSPLQHSYANGSTYYVDCSAGSNGNGSQGSPWNSLSSVNNFGTFQPGDQILLKRGMTCYGELAPAGSGSSGNLIQIDAYGSGSLPVIDAGTSNVAAIRTFNQSYWQVQNIETSGGSSFGICLCGSSGTQLASLHAVNVVVHDAHGSGTPYSALQIGEAENQSAPPIVTDALINGATVYNITNNEKGIMLLIGDGAGNGDTSQLGTGIIENSTVHDIGWDGIGLLYAKNSSVQNNVIYNTGTQSNGGGGNGIFTWSCNTCTVQYNEVYDAHSPYGTDGGGLDIDGNGTNNNIAQYNWVHDNDGACLLVYSANGLVTSNSIFRYNVCSNNARSSTLSTNGDVYLGNCTCDNGQGGTLDGVSIYNNTFYWNPSANHSMVDGGSAIWNSTQTYPDIFKNNLIYGVNQGADFVYTPSSSRLSLDYNLYWTTSSYSPRWFVQNGCNPCTSFSSYQSATGQDAHSLYTDPLLNYPGYANIGRPTSAQTLQSNSPALGAGTNVGNMGSLDFYGNSLGSTHNIGAYEGSGATITNIVQNPGFEADNAAVQSPQDWITWPGNNGTNAAASFTEAGGHTGSWRLAHWLPDRAYQVSTYQNLPNIPNGTYTATAWVQAYPNGNSTQQFIVRDQSGGTVLGEVNLPGDSPTTWVQVTINNIQITGGHADIEFYSDATANASIRADDVSLVKVS